MVQYLIYHYKNMSTKKTQTKKIDLMAKLKGTSKTVTIPTFRDNVLNLFSDIMKESNTNDMTKGKLARLRAQIEIELKELK